MNKACREGCVKKKRWSSKQPNMLIKYWLTLRMMHQSTYLLVNFGEITPKYWLFKSTSTLCYTLIIIDIQKSKELQK
jgi:uncharacterized membrane protein